MFLFYFFLMVLIAILGISSYSYEKIDSVTSDSDVSKKLSLSTLIITSVVLFFSFFLRFIDYIDLERGSNMLSFCTLVSSILLIFSYSYLDREMKSNPDYNTVKQQLDDVENNTNQYEKNLSFIISIVGFSIVAAYLFILIGKVFYSKTITTTITVKEPLIIEPEDKPIEKLDYEQLRKKFVI